MMRKGKDIQNIRVFAKTTRACNSINKETLAQVFFCEFGEISKNTFLHRPSLVTNFCLCVAKKKKKKAIIGTSMKTMLQSVKTFGKL